MKSVLANFLLMLVLGSCADKFVAEPTQDTLTIRSGISYGYCIGYCQRVLELTPTAAVFTKASNQPSTQYPTVSCTGAITESEWKTLETQANLAALQKQPQTIGCPDCADGGAEFLEIEQGGERYRVTFEAGKTIPGFESLVTALREKRATFMDCK